MYICSVQIKLSCRTMNKQKTVEENVNWLSAMLKLINDYGIINTLKATGVLILVILTLRICYDPSFLIKTYREYSNEIHTIEIMERTEADKQVKEKLPRYLYKYHSDRVWIIQCHNGISDWRYGSMRFEVCQEGVPSIKEEYEDFHLSWIDLYYYLEDHVMFIGSIEELKPIDLTLYTRFKKHDVTYLACIMIQDDSGHPIGVLGHTWCSDVSIKVYKNKIRDYLLEDRGDIKSHLKPINYK